MICKCGGNTADREVVRDKKVEGKYIQCRLCGRVSWTMKSEKLKAELNEGA